jgi:hypothetical protein
MISADIASPGRKLAISTITEGVVRFAGDCSTLLENIDWCSDDRWEKFTLCDAPIEEETPADTPPLSFTIHGERFEGLTHPPIAPQRIVDLESLVPVEEDWDEHEHADSVECKFHRGLCKNCRRCEATRMCSPCGHKVLCETCAAEFGSGHHVCPLCSTQVLGCIRVYGGEPVCAICRSAPAKTVIVPCGHECLCYTDALEMMTQPTNKRSCPLCRARMVAVKHEFDVYTENDETELMASLAKPEAPKRIVEHMEHV